MKTRNEKEIENALFNYNNTIVIYGVGKLERYESSLFYKDGDYIITKNYEIGHTKRKIKDFKDEMIKHIKEMLNEGFIIEII